MTPKLCAAKFLATSRLVHGHTEQLSVCRNASALIRNIDHSIRQNSPCPTTVSEMARPMNDDVLISIMDILVLESARSTAAAFMSLSRRLYHEGGKLLLSGNIDLRTSSDVSSFIAFCLAEDASRAACVRDLTFTINLLSPALASSLAEVIPRFIGIKKLVLTRADFLLRGHDALSRAFASLTSLEDLTLIKGSASAEFLTTLQSNLRNLTLFEIMIPRGLTGAQSTAELSTLNITYLWMDILVLEPYINTFPRLSRLTVTNGALRDLNSKRPRYAAFSCGLGGPQDLQNLRCINQAAQVDGGWEALEELDTDLATSWILGLSCKVVRLVLNIWRDASHLLAYRYSS
ncbi:hypothetical protein L227DRAFT_598110 [Lentinus tigrinus ALCF2SS1-6]|uniref:F-box domain-containing protein n=1 Tax=Lentinus tigrinus ALCF2SS1-6 TaxID=1328759 RepID=A0A5C2SLN1_9APHY|nr:hypothetical protein L227DRAFT_598110 [Lentinus tigrinus ALCF2SS1-6]